MVDTIQVSIDTINNIDTSIISELSQQFNLKKVIHDATNTQFFQGGALLGILAWLVASSHGFFYFIYSRFIRWVKYTTYMDDIESTDYKRQHGKYTLYDCLTVWIHENHPNKFKNTQLTLKEDIENEFTLYEVHNNDLIWFWYKKRLLFIDISKQTLENASDAFSRYINSYTVFGLFAKRQIKCLVNELEQIRNDKYQKFLLNQFEGKNIYYNNGYVWQEKNIKNVKTFDHLFFKGKNELINDLDKFKNNFKKYNSLNINFKRGYGLTGLPGEGKSSISLAIAKYLKRNIYYINLSSMGNDNTFIELFSKIKPNSVIVFEDIDTFFKGRMIDKADETKVTFSTLLQTFNGVYEPENCVMIITSNNVDALDSALLRTGRIDYFLDFKRPDFEVILDFINHFYSSDYSVDKFKNLKEKYNNQNNNRYSMSDIQNICITNCNKPLMVFKCLENICEKNTK